VFGTNNKQNEDRLVGDSIRGLFKTGTFHPKTIQDLVDAEVEDSKSASYQRLFPTVDANPFLPYFGRMATRNAKLVEALQELRHLRASQPRSEL
jgi:hypothetical protein